MLLLAVALAALALCADPAAAKVYDRCELANELLHRHGMSADEVPIWVCIARHESEFNTQAVGHVGEGGDHGIFQVSDIYWCSHSGRGKACGMSCSELLDDDISNDVACVKKIHREHQGLTGNGFNAWAVYSRYCKSPERAAKYVEGCFGGTGNEIVPQPFYGLPPPAITAPPPPARRRPRPTAATASTAVATVAARTYGLPATRRVAPSPTFARAFAPAPARTFARTFAPAAPTPR